MSRRIFVSTAAGEREFPPGELPLTIGTGADAALRVGGVVEPAPRALLGELDGRPFLQVAPGAALSVNGEPVRGSRWLADGDRIETGDTAILCEFDEAAWRFRVSGTIAADTLPPEPPATGADSERIEPILRRHALAAVAAAPPGAARSSRRWWLGGALALLLACAIYLFGATPVRVSVEPAAAEISIDTALPAPRIAGRYLLWPGVYRLRLSADGYRPREVEIQVRDLPAEAFEFRLEKLPGRIRVAAVPAVPVQVYVDGADAPLGTTFELPAGPHRLRVVAERYLPWEQAIEVEGLGREQVVQVSLQPGWADLTVRSEPPGATITAGDEVLGRTPATVPVMADVSELQLQLDGYKIHRQPLQLQPGQQLELPVIELQPADGLLSVRSDPPGAAVSIDGRYRGRTPVDVALAPGRRYQLIVSKPGYATVSREVRMQSRMAKSLSLRLEPRVGTLRISVEPADAELLVDGRLLGPANRELSLPARPHRIEIRRAGYASYTAELTPKPGLPQSLEVRLLTEAEAVLARRPRIVKTGQGLELLLVEPGELTLGAPRREQGRRPNEAQWRARLTRPYYLARREVTNTEFREFRGQHTSGAERYRALGIGDHPAVLVSWEEAVAFCNWLSDRDGLPRAYVVRDGDFVLADPPTTGYRLPTEAEWAWAARYSGGGEERRYPWGEHMPPPPGSGNFADRSAEGIVANVLSNYDDGYPVTAPVGRFQPSPLGFFDLGGNAAEWVHDRYTVYAGASGLQLDPTGPESGQYHVIRGSSWRHASISELRFAYRDFGDAGRLDVGFRIARWAEPEEQED
ncbi:MAG: PEGA domain-containing protein [Gammaproteobacteria bacterium]|nr:MAG: PEGA domain-containing protein [Gammaproteobacteria bacterium]